MNNPARKAASEPEIDLIGEQLAEVRDDFRNDWDEARAGQALAQLHRRRETRGRRRQAAAIVVLLLCVSSGAYALQRVTSGAWLLPESWRSETPTIDATQRLDATQRPRRHTLEPLGLEEAPEHFEEVAWESEPEVPPTEVLDQPASEAEQEQVAPNRRRHARWRPLAERGEFGRAYASLQGEGGGQVRDRVDDLLLAADAARLSGHPRPALRYLRQVTRRHRNDPRAALAAFTLGRVLLGRLGQPRAAASAFADARSLAPRGPLAEDALAREVEAYSRAGDASRARSRAQRYLERYRGGRWTRAVTAFGQVE